MAVNVIWDDAGKTILRYDFVGNWTWDEFFVAAAEFHAQLESVEHKVDTVINLLESAGIPGNTLSHVYSALQRQHPNDSGLNVIVSKAMIIQTLLNVFKRAYNSLPMQVELQLVSTLEEARVKCAEYRARKGIREDS